MNRQTLRKTALCAALGACLFSLGSVSPLQAANTDGSLLGRTAPGAEVTVVNPETGFTRSVTADGDGNYRFSYLPVGTYTLRAEQGGAAVGAPVEVRVSLGNATKVDVGTGDGTRELDTIQVVGNALSNPVDVTSTESATNVTREEFQRLPVDRSLTNVALLAPGLNRGDRSLGGLSFGGSSVAENSVYINGLNVTDFYNRIGFSEVPFAFYEEVQVKTGGYSVEFGRTTGGVINAITRSGTNEFHYGAELVWEPDFLQAEGRDFTDPFGNQLVQRYDLYDSTNLTVHASGPIIRDKLHFFAMYEARDFQPNNTSNDGSVLFEGDSDDGFYGGKLDWSITDRHLVELLAFSDQNRNVTDIYGFNSTSGERGDRTNTRFEDSGGDNWSATYTGYLTDSFSVKAMYGEVERNRATNSLNDTNCNRVFDQRSGVSPRDRGCTTSARIEKAVDNREAARLDFDWVLGDHLLRFGLDHETNTSDYQRFFPGPDALRFDIFRTTPGATLANGGVVPAGVTSYVRTRRLEVDGTFETENSAYYLEDTWSVTPNLVLNAGLRLEAFDNKNSEGDSYIKIDDMVAPRLGLAWDVHGDGRSKVFANVGRYFLPVANVINIKQAGGFLDERTFYVFNGYQDLTNNGRPYQLPILGPQIGPVDNSQGDGTVGDLRGEVDADMDPVYQDEAILGFQGMLDDRWSWGVRGIYRRLKNAIDDMNITSNGILCNGRPGSVGFVMANPGRVLTVYTDTNCDGVPDGFVDIDTSVAGFALLDDNRNYVRDVGFAEPRRTYQAVEFVLDRAWDEQWALNASYTWSRSRGNAEGPVNSDTNFGDSGRTEAFDDPWVNFNGYGDLPNDRRHQFKARGTYALSDNWLFGGTLNLQSGRPINAFGVGNPFDRTNYHSFYTCVANCTSTIPSQRVYEFHGRGSEGTTPWTYDVGASVTYLRSFGEADLRIKFAVYNLFNSERTIEVDEDLQTTISNELNETFRQPVAFQSPRYAQLTVSLEF